MKKALIVTSYIEHISELHLTKNSYDLIISVDGGFSYCEKLNLQPDLVIGDWDSLNQNLPENCKKITLDPVKDYTDADAAVNYSLEHGFDHITVLGGLGGRFDHTMGALSLLTKKFHNYKSGVVILDGKNLVYMLEPGEYSIPTYNYKYLGLFSYSNCCKNLTISGVKYPLDNYTLHNNTNIGVSNQITDGVATLSFTDGTLLVVHSNE